jgi:hypothetical protein
MSRHAIAHAMTIFGRVRLPPNRDIPSWAEASLSRRFIRQLSLQRCLERFREAPAEPRHCKLGRSLALPTFLKGRGIAKMFESVGGSFQEIAFPAASIFILVIGVKRA